MINLREKDIVPIKDRKRHSTYKRVKETKCLQERGGHSTCKTEKDSTFKREKET